VTAERDPGFPELEATLKRATAALRRAEIPFMLGGSLASWARGGPETRHDLDLMIRPEDADRALEALEEAGMRPERPPEEWLVKAWDGDVLVDLIFRPSGMQVDDDALARAEALSVLSMEMRVMSLEDVVATKLLSMNDHNADYEGVLQISRALREQVEWDAVRERTAGNPYAKAFFVLIEALGIVPEVGAAEAAATPDPEGPRPAAAWAIGRGD
jgi:hypothetical protein